MALPSLIYTVRRSVPTGAYHSLCSDISTLYIAMSDDSACAPTVQLANCLFHATKGRHRIQNIIAEGARESSGRISRGIAMSRPGLRYRMKIYAVVSVRVPSEGRARGYPLRVVRLASTLTRISRLQCSARGLGPREVVFHVLMCFCIVPVAVAR